MAFKPGITPKEKPGTTMKECCPRTKESEEMMYPWAESASPFNKGPGVAVHDTVFSPEDETECNSPCKVK